MALLHTSSLAATLDAVDEAFFLGKTPSKREREEVANWLASRQGLPGSYAGMFAPPESYRPGTRLKLFTGDGLSSRGGALHVLGEEACRALILLDVQEPPVPAALRRATEGMLSRIGRGTQQSGRYCCGTCSAALWRHLAAGGLQQPERLLAGALKTLRTARDGEGRWKGYPFWYGVLALSEVPLPAAQAELRYAAAALERALRRGPGDDVYAKRRRVLAERVLTQC